MRLPLSVATFEDYSPASLPGYSLDIHPDNHAGSSDQCRPLFREGRHTLCRCRRSAVSTPTSYRCPGEKRLTTKVQMGCCPSEPPTRPKPVEIRHLQLHYSRIGVQHKVMSPMPRSDQTGTHHWATPRSVEAPWRCSGFVSRRMTNDIPHFHRLPLAVLLLHGRS